MGKTYTKEELKEVLDKHGKWLRGEEGGEIANLRSADLRFANLRSANLRFADLSSANLRSANLRFADLRSANLRFANLRFADLSSADLRSADLRSANLRSAKNWEEAVNLNYWIVPEEGEFIAYKAVRQLKTNKVAILTLRIPAEAERACSYRGRKCRASLAVPIKAEDKDGKVLRAKKYRSNHNPNFVWEIGKEITPDKFDPTPHDECSNGLHIWVTKKEARNWL